MEQNSAMELRPQHVAEEDLNEALMATLAIVGMGCSDCATRVRASLLQVDGVVSADVDFARGLALVDYVPTKTNPRALVRAVSRAGDEGHHAYQAIVIS